MNQRRRLIVKDVCKTTAGEVSVLSQLLQMFSKTNRDKGHQTEETGSAHNSKLRDKSVMTLKPDKDTNTGISISDFLFLGCLF